MTTYLTREELDRLLIQALTAERTRPTIDEPDPDYPQHNAGRDAATEHGCGRWFR